MRVFFVATERRALSQLLNYTMHDTIVYHLDPSLPDRLSLLPDRGETC